MKGRRNPCLHFSCCFLPPLPPLSPLDKSYAPLFAAFTFPYGCRAQSRQQTGLVQPFLARSCSETCTFPHNASNDRQGSEENTSELQEIMRTKYAVFGLQKKDNQNANNKSISTNSLTKH